MKILFSGGGTLGPVTPLLALYDVIRKHLPETTFLWVGTKNGPELELVKRRGIPFVTISSGKLRRYISLDNVIDIGRMGIGFLEALILLDAEKPDLCISAGGYVSVPIHLAANIRHIPTWIHVQDVDIGLANRIMGKYATAVSVGIEKNLDAFPNGKTFFLGNPVRADLLRKRAVPTRRRFSIRTELPVVFVTGGGTGSARVNEIVAGSLEPLRGVCEIIHLTGTTRSRTEAERLARLFPEYHPYPFFTREMASAYALADIVVSRAGFGTLSEAAAFGKPLILIPKEGHQEKNAAYAAERHAAIVLDQNIGSGHELAAIVKELLADRRKRNDTGLALRKLLPVAKEEDIMNVLNRLGSKKA